jgi:hypothetical protein
MSLIIVINFLIVLLTYKFSDFFFNKMCLLIKKRKKASSIASITLFKGISGFSIVGLYCGFASNEVTPEA